jgi:hypothetical protein
MSTEEYRKNSSFPQKKFAILPNLTLSITTILLDRSLGLLYALSIPKEVFNKHEIGTGKLHNHGIFDHHFPKSSERALPRLILEIQLVY